MFLVQSIRGLKTQNILFTIIDSDLPPKSNFPALASLFLTHPYQFSSMYYPNLVSVTRPCHYWRARERYVKMRLFMNRLLTSTRTASRTIMPGHYQPFVHFGDRRTERTEIKSVPSTEEEVAKYYCCSCDKWQEFADDKTCNVCTHRSCIHCLIGR